MKDRHPTPHLSDDQLIDLLYGIGDADGHLEICPACDARWEDMQRALGRTRVESAAEISTRRLAIQRQQILERLESPGSPQQGWIPAAAAASLVAMALFFSWSSSPRPRVVAPPSAPVAAANTESDAELFTDVYSMERDVEPQAAAPIHALFQQASFESIQAEESIKQ